MKYHCTFEGCKKSFKSKQALGGHMNGHRKDGHKSPTKKVKSRILRKVRKAQRQAVQSVVAPALNFCPKCGTNLRAINAALSLNI